MNYFTIPGLMKSEHALTPDFILNKVSLWYNIPVKDICAKNRQRRICDARHAAIYIMRRKAKMSFILIGKAFEQDHTTVVHAAKVITHRMEVSTDFRKDIEDLICFVDGLTGISEIENYNDGEENNTSRPPAEYSNHSPYGIASEYLNQKAAS